MRRAIPVLSLILACQVALAALLSVRTDPLAASTPQTPLIKASIRNVDHLLIEGRAATAGAAAGSGTAAATGATERVELVKQDGKWMLPGYFNAPADKFKLNDVLDELADLKRGLPIATTSSALKRFKVTDDTFERRLTLSEGGKVLSTVYFGSSAGVRKTDARTAQEHAVYNVDLATYELPTQPSGWFDAGILEGDAKAFSQLQVTASGQPTLTLLRQKRPPAPATAAKTAANSTAASKSVATSQSASADAPVWVAPMLPPGSEVNGAHADALARDVADLRVDSILGMSPQPEWQQDRPLLTLVIHTDKRPGQADTWTLSAPRANANANAPRPRAAHATGAAGAKASAPEYYVLKDSAHPWYFKVSAETGKQLLDASQPATLLSTQQAARKPPQHSRAGERGTAHTHRQRRAPART
jgi:Domain of unknown function (DUF4340)